MHFFIFLTISIQQNPINMIIRNNIIINKFLNVYKRIMGNPDEHHGLRYLGYCDLLDQEANDYIYELLSTGRPIMISKFGTVELSNIIAQHIHEVTGLTKEVIHDYAHYNNVSIYRQGVLDNLCSNAGFFPNDMEKGRRYYQLMMEDIKQIDVLGSYIYDEKYVAPYMNCLKRVNIDGYFSPYCWKNPWSKVLKGKRVLVVHPFVESIKYQYEYNREQLFTNPDVLPEFKELILIKAVQTQANAKDPRFNDWFEALQYMKDEIDKHEYDIALIGCGAYGMCLAAHVKRQGKQAVHLASMTQMIFGVYGKRWVESEPVYKKYINEYWIRPGNNEKPLGANRIEGGCYW